MSRLKSVKPYRPTADLSTIRRPPKVFNSTIEKLDEPSKPSKPSKLSKSSEPGVGAGHRAAVRVKELTVENIYDNIKFLENKLKDNNLTVAEYKKISDDIYELRKSLLKGQMELEEDKKDLERRIRTHEAKPFMDQNKEFSGNGFGKRFDISAKEFDIKSNYDNVIAFNYMLKSNKLTQDERKDILNIINNIKENISKKEKGLDKLKKEKRIK